MSKDGQHLLYDKNGQVLQGLVKTVVTDNVDETPICEATFLVNIRTKDDFLESKELETLTQNENLIKGMQEDYNKLRSSMETQLNDIECRYLQLRDRNVKTNEEYNNLAIHFNNIPKWIRNLF